MNLLLLVLFVIQSNPGIPDVYPNPTAEWTMGASDVTDLAEAQRRIYRYYIDAATEGTRFQEVTCQGEFKPYTCHGKLNYGTQGIHTVALTNSWADDSATSEKSATVTFNVVASEIAPPYNGLIRIK